MPTNRISLLRIPTSLGGSGRACRRSAGLLLLVTALASPGPVPAFAAPADQAEFAAGVRGPTDDALALPALPAGPPEAGAMAAPADGTAIDDSLRRALAESGILPAAADLIHALDSQDFARREWATLELVSSDVLPTGRLFALLEGHRDVLQPEQFERLMDIMELRYLTSIAVVGIQMDSRNRESGVTIQHIFDGAPAATLLRPGDVMLAIEGKPLVGLDAVRVIQQTVSGRWPGESVLIRVARPIDPANAPADGAANLQDAIPDPQADAEAGDGGDEAGVEDRADENEAVDPGLHPGEQIGDEGGGRVVGDGIEGHLIIDFNIVLADATTLPGFDSPTLSSVRMSAWEGVARTLRPDRTLLSSIDASAKLEPGAAGSPRDLPTGVVPDVRSDVDEQMKRVGRLVDRAQEVLADMRDLQSRLRRYEAQSELAIEMRERLREVASEYQVLRSELAQLGYNTDGSRLRTTFERGPAPVRRDDAGNPPAGAAGGG